MAIKLDILNFRTLRTVRLHDDNKMSVVIGENESGKSSLISAVQFVFTGSAFGHKGTSLEPLVRHGEAKMAVKVEVANLAAARTKAGGNTLKSIAEQFKIPSDCLPLLFDARMNGDGGCKAMQTFLDSMSNTSFDALACFAERQDLLPAVEQAVQAVGKNAKKLVKYCEEARASIKEPTAPTTPTNALAAEDYIKQTGKRVENAAIEYNMAINAHKDSVNTLAKLKIISEYTNSLAGYEAGKIAASKEDPWRENREVIVGMANLDLVYLKDLMAKFSAFIPLVRDLWSNSDTFGPEEICELVEREVNRAKAMIEANPTPASMPNKPILPAEAQQLFDDLSNGGINLHAKAMMQEVIGAAKLDVDNLSLVCTKTHTDLVSAQEQLADMLRVQGAWNEYKAAQSRYADEQTRAKREWDMWDLIAKTITKAELEFTNTAGNAFGTLVAEFSSTILQGRTVKINKDTGIWLGTEHITDCSDSTRWRIEIAVMAAVARTLKSPLLLIDGLDILSPANNSLFTKFLIERILPFFEHVIVTKTPKSTMADEKAAPKGSVFTKWLMVNGELTKL